MSRIGQPPPGGGYCASPPDGNAVNPSLDLAWKAYPWDAEHASAADGSPVTAERSG
ncbi:hypothetical protein [Streptomyces sp. NPDC001135]